MTRATLLQPIRNEVIKKQSQILTELLSFLSKENFDKGVDYVGIASANTYLSLKDYGFIFKDQTEILDRVNESTCGWLFCGEDKIIRDVEIVGMFAEDEEEEGATSEIQKLGKERFENAKKGKISIERIYLTSQHVEYFKQLSEYAENPFLPYVIQEVLKKLISDVLINLNIHLKTTLTRFVEEFFKRYLSKKSYPKISPLGVYNDFNHSRIHHNIELNRLKKEIKNHLKIEEEW